MQTDDLYAGFKHGDSIKRIISYMHESWMDESEKREFDELMVRIHGKDLDIAIDSFTNKGYPTDALERELAILFNDN